MGVLLGLKNMFKIAQMMGSAEGNKAYSGAGFGRKMFNWRPPHTGPNEPLIFNHSTLIARSRDLGRNDPWGAAMNGRRVVNMIGTGIKPKSMAPTAEAREMIQDLFLRWTDQSDADGVTDFYGQQEMVAREWCDAGECFGRFRFRRPKDGLIVPLQIQLIESEQVPVTHNTISPIGNAVRAGIERDRIGRRVGYYMYREHPGEFHTTRADASSIIRVPGDEVVHVFQPLRAGQIRGLPSVTPILARLYGVNQYDEATVLRQWVGTLFAGFFKRPTSKASSIDPLTGLPREQDSDGIDMSSLEAATMYEMPPGWEVDFSEPPEAGSTYEVFMRQQLMSAAAAVGMSYEILAQDMRGINDRLLRALLHEFRRGIQMLQHHMIVFQLCRPIWERWMDTAVLVGALKFPDYEERRAEYLKVRWVPQSWPYLHPVQDVQAAKDEITAGLSTRSEHVSERGGDVEQVDRENKQDQDRAEKHKLRYTTDLRNPVKQKKPGANTPPPADGDVGDPEKDEAELEDDKDKEQDK